MMFNREVTMGSVLAWIAWAASLLMLLAGTTTLILADSIHSHATVVGIALLAHALAGLMIATTLSVKQMVQQQREAMRDAFDMGRDVADRRIGSTR